MGVGVHQIQSHNLGLARRLSDGLASLGAQFVSPSVDNLHSSIVTVRFPGRDHVALARRLFDKCVVVSPRMGSLRIAPHLYNTADDIDRALEVLEGTLGEA
jgi:selenocysteine lyase/cysteine desulfurase